MLLVHINSLKNEFSKNQFHVIWVDIWRRKSKFHFMEVMALWRIKRCNPDHRRWRIHAFFIVIPFYFHPTPTPLEETVTQTWLLSLFILIADFPPLWLRKIVLKNDAGYLIKQFFWKPLFQKYHIEKRMWQNLRKTALRRRRSK